MKVIKYRRYWYGGDFSSEELAVPDDCLGFKVPAFSVSQRVDENIWTSGFIFISNSPMEDSVEIGDKYYLLISNIFVTQSDITISEDISEAPKFRNCYIVEKSTDFEVEAELKKLNFSLENVLTEEQMDYMTNLLKKRETLCGIDKLRRFTDTGIEIARIVFRSCFTGRTMSYMEITEIPYSRFNSQSFTSDEEIAERFKDEAYRIYDTAIE